jgi:hypothetical protein
MTEGMVAAPFGEKRGYGRAEGVRNNAMTVVSAVNGSCAYD